MRVLVTGSAGFVASRLRLSDHFVKQVDLVDGLDVGDLAIEDAIRHFDPEIVFHLAAKHYIPWCNAHPDETFRTNVNGTAHTLLACGPSLRTFVFASSAAVYGFSSLAIRESHPLQGHDIYASTKQRGEGLLQAFSERRPDVRCVTARLFNIVGAGDGHAHVLPRMIDELRGSRAVTLGNLWPRRDYVHVEDAADALRFLAAKAPEGFSVWNVGTGIGTSVAELVGLVEQVGGQRFEVKQGVGRHDDGHLVADPSALREFGWEAQHTLEDAVREAWDAADA